MTPMPPAPPPPIRVFCVDDNEMIAKSLARRIECESGIALVGLVHDGTVAYERVMEVTPDVVLMDIDMPGVDTFSIVERLSVDAPRVRVVMFSGHVNRAFIDRALDCGVWGYLSKNDDVARIIDGIRGVARGEIVLSREVHAVYHMRAP